MHSLISNYAVEGRTNGKPNGHFYMTKSAMQSITDEVVEQHLGFTGDRKNNFVFDVM